MGKPTWVHIQVSITQFIGNRRQTGGTETSKYPEEEKENSIPSVAASERGRAQTDGVYFIGVVDTVVKKKVL